MILSVEHICAALLLCGFCAVSESAHCPDFSDVDFCDNDDDRLEVSFATFVECNTFVTPRNARHEPVVKYDYADEVHIVALCWNIEKIVNEPFTVSQWLEPYGHLATILLVTSSRKWGVSKFGHTSDNPNDVLNSNPNPNSGYLLLKLY